MIVLVALTAAVLVASCSSDDDAAPSTPAPATTPAATEAVADTTTPATTEPATTAPATTEPATTEPATTAPATTEPATTRPVGEVLVFEGTHSDPNNSAREWQGDSGLTLFSNSINLDGDLVGNMAFFGYIEGPDPLYTIKGDWVVNVTSPELGEGVLAVQNWTYEGSATSGSGTGDVIGLSGGFTDLVGTISTTDATYVIELQRIEPAPTAAEPTETMTIDFVGTSTTDIAWAASELIVGGGATLSGDIVGSASFRSTLEGVEASVVGAGALAGEGDGVFVIILRSPVFPDDTSVAWEADFYGLSGAFAGLRGAGTAATTTTDATGAFAPVTTYNFELSR